MLLYFTILAYNFKRGVAKPDTTLVASKAMYEGDKRFVISDEHDVRCAHDRSLILLMSLLVI